MSIEFFVYSGQTSIPDFPSLQEALLKEGWHTMQVDSMGEKELPGKALANESLYGAKDATTLAEVRTLVAKGDSKALDLLFEQERVGGCGLSTSSPFDATEEYGEDWSDNFPSAVSGDIAKAKSHYCIRTAAGRGEFAYQFQVAVWEAVASLVGGVMEDPQSGRYLRMGPTGPTVLFETETEPGSPQEMLLKFFDAAKAAGFPVSAAKGGDVSLNTGGLAPADLERLLQLTRSHFPPEDPTGPGMAAMILEEYERGKGKAFAREQAAWLHEMRDKYAGYS